MPKRRAGVTQMACHLKRSQAKRGRAENFCSGRYYCRVFFLFGSGQRIVCTSTSFMPFDIHKYFMRFISIPLCSFALCVAATARTAASLFHGKYLNQQQRKGIGDASERRNSAQFELIYTLFKPKKQQKKQRRNAEKSWRTHKKALIASEYSPRQ